MAIGQKCDGLARVVVVDDDPDTRLFFEDVTGAIHWPGGDVGSGIAGGTIGQAAQTYFGDAPHAAFDAGTSIMQNYINKINNQECN
jgi:hypothetical protein